MSGEYVHYTQISHLETLCWRSSAINKPCADFLAGHTIVWGSSLLDCSWVLLCFLLAPCLRHLLGELLMWPF